MTDIVQAIGKVFREPSYAILAGVVALVAFALIVWMPNVGLLVSIALDPEIALSDKLSFPLELLRSITTNFTALSASYMIAMAILLGVNSALFAYLYRSRVVLTRMAGASGFFGMMSGALGVGCAACGSLLLTTLLGAAGAASVLAFFPLGGEEFGVAGAVLLGTTTHLLTKQITKPHLC